jgi:hypothetical protein
MINGLSQPPEIRETAMYEATAVAATDRYGWRSQIAAGSLWLEALAWASVRECPLRRVWNLLWRCRRFPPVVIATVTSSYRLESS